MPMSNAQWGNLSRGWQEPLTIDYVEYEAITDAMKQFGEGAGKIIDQVIQGPGADLIGRNITNLLPRSGRKWKGKGKAAADAMPKSFVHEYFPMSVQIVARGKYRYLYFPDDGTNTRRHAGNQQFMYKGAEQSSGRIVEMCVGALLDNFNGG